MTNEVKGKRGRPKKLAKISTGETLDKDRLHEEKEFKRRYNYTTLNFEEYKKRLESLSTMDLCSEGVRHGVKVSSAMHRNRIIYALAKEFQSNITRFKTEAKTRQIERNGNAYEEKIRLQNVTANLFRKVIG